MTEELNNVESPEEQRFGAVEEAEEQEGIVANETEEQTGEIGEEESTEEKQDNLADEEGEEGKDELSDESLEEELSEEDLADLADKAKSSEQERIDMLEEKLKEALDRLATYERRTDESSKPKEKVYTDEELAIAERKAIEDGNMELLVEVTKQRMKNLERNLVSRYEREQQEKAKQLTERAKQWALIESKYSSDDPRFDIRNPKSQLYKLAEMLYTDPKMSKMYRGPNGMEQAVADAFLKLTRTIRSKKIKSPKEKRLERRLAKERAKGKIVTGKSTKGSFQKKVANKKSELDEYLEERRRTRQKAMGL